MNSLLLQWVVLMYEPSFQQILHPEKSVYTCIAIAWWLFLCNQHPDEKDIIRSPKHSLRSFLIMVDFQQHGLVLPVYNLIQMKADTQYSFVPNFCSALCLCNSSLSLYRLGDFAFPVLCNIPPRDNTIFPFFFFLNFLLYIGVELINNVVIVSGEH